MPVKTPEAKTPLQTGTNCQFMFLGSDQSLGIRKVLCPKNILLNVATVTTFNAQKWKIRSIDDSSGGTIRFGHRSRAT